MSYRYSFLRIALIVVVQLFVAGHSAAALAEEAMFRATSACPAYESKNKKTNTGAINVAVGTSYRVAEILPPDSPAPSWYRLQVDGAPNSALRWVSADCGSASGTVAAAHGGGNGAGAACSVGGQADGYVFAVSWQSAFCAGRGDKPECRVDNPAAWSGKNFTLHGLWPNKSSCGTRYGFCSIAQAKAFCDYPEPPISPEVFKQLAEVMPSAGAGSCLQRHEWYKHGTCQTQWNADGYFKVAIELTRQFNDSGVAAFMQSNMGKTVRTADFIGAIDKSLGVGAHRGMKIMCSSGMLVDIYIDLPSAIATAPNLRDLVARGGTGFSSSCGDRFEVAAGRQ